MPSLPLPGSEHQSLIEVHSIGWHIVRKKEIIVYIVMETIFGKKPRVRPKTK